MAAPKSLTGAPTTITVDGVDLHVYGVTINSVDNPLPAAIESTINMLGLDGAIDFTKNYGPRQISITGEITADSHALMLTYIDALTALFRLRENSEIIKVVFSDQPDRYWPCRYSGFSPKLKSLKNYGKTAALSLSFVCSKPYAEAVTITSAKVRLNMNRNIVLNYTGTVKTPINFNLTYDKSFNILDLVGLKVSSEDPTAWTYSNATGSTSGSFIYGSNSVSVNRTSAGAYYAEIDISTMVVTGKNLIFGGYARRADSGEAITLQVVSNEGTIKSSTFAGSGGQFNFAQIKLLFSEYIGRTGIRCRVYCAGSLNSSFLIDGVFVYEASDSDIDFDTTSYVAPPYIPLTSVYPTNAKLVMVAGKNIFPLNNGENTWNGSGVSSCNDPIGGESCIMFYLTGLETVRSPLIPISQGKTYKLALNKFITLINPTGSGAVFSIRTRFYNEVGGNVDGGSDNDFSNIDTFWSTSQIRIAAPLGAIYIMILVDSTNAECKAYLKDIAIEEEVVSNDAFNSYTPYNKSEQSYLGSITSYDEVNLNNEKLTTRFNNWSTKISTNAMQYFVGDKIELMPGVNTLRYYDARYGSTHPEVTSRGSCICMYSYRARYL